MALITCAKDSSRVYIEFTWFMVHCQHFTCETYGLRANATHKVLPFLPTKTLGDWWCKEMATIWDWTSSSTSKYNTMNKYFIACYLRIMLDFFYGNQFFYITFAFDLCSKKANYFSLIFFLCYFLYSVLYVRGCQVIHIEILIFPRASFCVSQNGNMYLELSVA